MEGFSGLDSIKAIEMVVETADNRFEYRLIFEGDVINIYVGGELVGKIKHSRFKQIFYEILQRLNRHREVEEILPEPVTMKRVRTAVVKRVEKISMDKTYVIFTYLTPPALSGVDVGMALTEKICPEHDKLEAGDEILIIMDRRGKITYVSRRKR